MKNVALNFSLLIRFFNFFCFGIYKMVDSTNIYKSLNISIGTIIKNREMLKFDPDHLKSKIMQLKKSPNLLRYVPDQYKTQQMCYKATLENGGPLKSVLTAT